MQAVLELAISTKTDGLLYGLLDKETAHDVEASAASVLSANLAQLDCTIRVSKLLRDADIKGLAFKGCLRANEVYGRIDARRSTDIDFLVPRADYEHACEALTLNGFKPLVSPESKWWHQHLGESPFLMEDGSGMIVDLHNSLQQPGGPYPRDLGEFFLESTTQCFGNEVVHQLAPQHALLVCAISYGKAVREGQPWLSHAHEIATCLAKMSGTEQGKMQMLAARQGLSRVYSDAVHGAIRLFGPTAPDTVETDPPQELVLSAVGHRFRSHFSRTRELWRWCDGNGIERVGNFGAAISRVLLRDLAQFREDLNGKRKLQLSN